MQAENDSGAFRTFDDPACRFEDADDVLPLQVGDVPIFRHIGEWSHYVLGAPRRVVTMLRR